jgi:hypothetical protein
MILLRFLEILGLMTPLIHMPYYAYFGRVRK